MVSRIGPRTRRHSAIMIGLLLLLVACAGDPKEQITASPKPISQRSASPPKKPSASTPAAASEFTVLAVGDVLVHERLWQQAAADGAAGQLDFRPQLAAVKPLISAADLAVCHLETPVASPKGPNLGYPAFSVPPQIIPALKDTGFDACSTGSNHTFDQGSAGIDRTLNSLDQAKIAHSGSARTEQEAERSTLISVAGAKVALLSFSYGFNGFDYPAGQRWRANVIDLAQILRRAKQARTAGADVVLLAMHWGTEYSAKPSAQQRDLMPKLAASSDIDVVLSHHAHVVEPIQKIGNKWVTYGLGNFLAWHSTPGDANAEGLAVRFTFAQRNGKYVALKAEYAPLLVARSAPIRLLPIAATLASGRFGSSSQARLEAAQRRTTAVVTSLGGRDSGLVPISSSR